MSTVVAEKAPDFTLLTARRMMGSLDDHRTEGLLVLCLYAGDGPGIWRSERQGTPVLCLSDHNEVETVLGDLDRVL